MKFGSGSNEKLMAIRGNSGIISSVSWMFQISWGEKLSLWFKNFLFIEFSQDNLESTVCGSSVKRDISEERLYWENGELPSRFY